MNLVFDTNTNKLCHMKLIDSGSDGVGDELESLFTLIFHTELKEFLEFLSVVAARWMGPNTYFCFTSACNIQ